MGHVPLSGVVLAPPSTPPRGLLLLLGELFAVLRQFMALVWGEDRPGYLLGRIRVLGTAPGWDSATLPTSPLCPAYPGKASPPTSTRGLQSWLALADCSVFRSLQAAC